LLLATAAAVAACGPADDAQPPAAAEGVLTGTVLYRERMALPPGAAVEVHLEDTSIADAPAVVLAEQTIATDGRQVPIPFELRYAIDRIEPNHRYGVRAAIRAADGELVFATTAHHAVLASGAPENVEILVQRVGARPASGPALEAGGGIPGGVWRLIAIQRPAGGEEIVGVEPRYTVEFGAAGGFGGQAHCNQYSGGYQQPEAGRLVIAPIATTLAACQQPSIADDFLRLLGSVTAYEMRGTELHLSSGEGATLRFARDDERTPATPETGRTLVYDCDGDVSFTVRSGPGEVALWAPASLGGQYLVLPATRAASGARFQEGDTVYWSKGDVATFEIAGSTFVDCLSNPRKVPWADAARRGVIFRAVGNEPGWYLEIHSDRLVAVTDYGSMRTELAYTEPTVAGRRTVYRASGDGHEMVAVVERGGCTDTMSGEAFEATATVTLDGAMYHGCGRFL
jgi:putative lipoprotein